VGKGIKKEREDFHLRHFVSFVLIALITPLITERLWPVFNVLPRRINNFQR